MFPSGSVWDSIPSVQEVLVSGAQGEWLSACATEEKPAVKAQGEFLNLAFFSSTLMCRLETYCYIDDKKGIRSVRSSEEEVSLYSCCKTVSIS